MRNSELFCSAKCCKNGAVTKINRDRTAFMFILNTI